jgi:hypothetical protein
MERSVNCPYCGELIDVLIDPTDMGEAYIEDCQVCCRAINFRVSSVDNTDDREALVVSVYTDDEI